MKATRRVCPCMKKYLRADLSSSDSLLTAECRPVIIHPRHSLSRPPNTKGFPFSTNQVTKFLPIIDRRM